MKLARSVSTIALLALLTGCSALQTTPKPPPEPIAGKAQEITRAQTYGLEKMTTTSAWVRGSPMNVEAEIQRRATASGARYYLIIMNSETVVPGQWYSQAILYR